ncbi:MAG: thioredoxin-like domain-containing protein [Opitutaceae bacterium]|nr:thioredoxin-like domain-containing protein [Opitutaceae bacterium]
MKTLLPIALAALVATTAVAQDLTLAELARRPELLPSQVTLKQPVKLQGRPAMAIGQKLILVSVRGTSVELETPDGRSVFTTKADDTDVLAVAQQTWQGLNPEQRALTYATLLQRKDLWPYRVKLTQAMRLSSGDLKPGTPAILVGVEGSQLLLVYEQGKFLFNAEPRDTDLLESARKFIADKNAFPSRISEDLAGKLVSPASGAPVTREAKADPKFFVFYRGAGWCGPCVQFSPSLVKFDKDAKAKHPGAYEIVFISGDKTPAEMKAYAGKMGFAWAAVPQSRQPETQIVNRLFTNLIPQLVITDRAGSVIIDSARTGGPDNALRQFAALLKK